MIFEGDKKLHTVTPDELDQLLKNGDIRITAKEIRDKGRGDGLSKGLILIQTTWFILQCIARKVKHLPITQLELVTLAFAALNFLTYTIWWNKPLDVECSMRVYRNRGGEKKDSASTEGTAVEDTGNGRVGENQVWNIIAKDIKATTMAGIADLIRKLPGTVRNASRGYIREYRWHVAWHVLAALLLPVSVPAYLFLTAARMWGNSLNHNDEVIKKGAQRVPPFYAGPPLTSEEDLLDKFAAMVIAVIFGGIHCVAWSFDFLSHIEPLSWRIASIAITSAPVFVFMVPLVVYIQRSNDKPILVWVVVMPVRVIGGIGCVVYVISRLLLLVLPFIALRSLPVEAYQTVQWTTFIPHV